VRPPRARSGSRCSERDVRSSLDPVGGPVAASAVGRRVVGGERGRGGGAGDQQHDTDQRERDASALVVREVHRDHVRTVTVAVVFRRSTSCVTAATDALTGGLGPTRTVESPARAKSSTFPSVRTRT